MFFGLICRFPKFFGLLKLVRNSPTGLKTCPKQSDSDYFGFLFILKLISFQSESVRISPNKFFFGLRINLFGLRKKYIFMFFGVRNYPKLSETVRSDPIGSDWITSPKSFLVRQSPIGFHFLFSDSMKNFRTQR